MAANLRGGLASRANGLDTCDRATGQCLCGVGDVVAEIDGAHVLSDAPSFDTKWLRQGGHMIMAPGAVPIIRNGVVEGACGVSGGTSQQDEDCARAGVAQL